MQASSFWRVTALVVIFGAAALITPAQDASQQPSGDPVADAARKARAEQKKEPKPKKVFTNDDIPSAPVAASTPAPTDQNKDQGGGKQSAEPITGKKEQSGDEKKGESYWRKRFSEVRQKISETQQELEILQKELNKDQVQYYSDPQKAMMQQHDRSDINERTAKIDAKKKELDALNQKLSDMEDELRRAGGDPGWAR
ncbi:MAG TPA: hypothetical protein VKB48_03975 [Candidatus Acidoferrum sp.]|nr:hypothetical protein [Candidatus Acidoferrum sp.]